MQHPLFDGKYRIIKTLGTGGSGSVFLAENVRLGTLWAIKEIRKNQGETVHLLTEPHVLKNLRHPALPRIFDIIESKETFHIVQDYIEGQTLEDIILHEGPVPEKKLVDWGLEVCDVYRYLHDQKPYPIIYRDMKPQNLIIDLNGRMRLIDFGIAREFKATATNDTLCLGTRGYAAPEQYGTRQTDVRSDLYSLGVTLYHALTGIGPNDAPFEKNLLAECEGPWSTGFARIIDKATKLDPGQRFQNAEDMQKALEQIKQTHSTGYSTKGGRGKGGVGPVVFGVGGVESRCGVTHHAVMLAHYLARTRRERVPLVEFNTSPCFESLNPGNASGAFEDLGVLYNPHSIQNSGSGLNFNAFREYSAVVLDLGVLKPFQDGIMTPGLSYLEMSRVHCPILVSSGAPWRLSSLIAFNFAQENLDGWNLMIAPTSDKAFERIVSVVPQYFSSRRLYHSVFEPDPFRIGKVQEEQLGKIVEEYLPSREKGFWGFIKRAGRS